MTADESTKVVLDVASGGVVLATLAQWLPPLAALASLVYVLLRIIEWVNKKSWRHP
jgi:hypothetical protein